VCAYGCVSVRFARNPQYVFQCSAASTTAVLTLSQADHRWQHPQPPLKKYESLLGFFVVRLVRGGSESCVCVRACVFDTHGGCVCLSYT
jgi:hypothetical protein